MGTSRKRALEYAYDLLSQPRAHMRVELRQVSDGVVLKHGRRVLTKVYLNRSGMNAAVAMAEALGIKGYSLAHSNPLYEIADGSELAAEAYRETIRLYTTAVQIAEFMMEKSLVY